MLHVIKTPPPPQKKKNKKLGQFSQYRPTDSIGLLTRLLDGKPENHSSIPGKGKSIVCYAERSDRL
jgi:hypothetical protein